jgi:polar amino acid transport system substrate-binding protein
LNDQNDFIGSKKDKNPMALLATLRKMNNRLLLCSVVVAMAGLISTLAHASDRPSLKVAVEGIFPPFNYRDANGALQGFDVDIAKALCAVAKLECEFVVQDWDGMIPNLLAKRYDTIISSMSMSQERRQKVAFTQRYYDSPSVFVVRKGYDRDPAKPGSLAGVRLGVTSSTSQASYAEKFYPDAEIVVFPASPALYAGLADGRVDIILEDKLAVYDWLENTRAGGCCEFRGQDIKDATYFGDGAGVAVRQEDTQLLQALDDAIDMIKSDGTYDAINAKYFPFSIQ